VSSPPPGWTRYLVPRVQDLVFLSVFYLAILLGPSFLGDGDPGKHVLIGEQIVAHRSPQVYNDYSYTLSGLPIPTTEWLSELIFALAHRLAGLDGVVLLSALIVATTFTVVFRETVAGGAFYSVAAFLVIWGVLASLFHWLARPHLITWLLLAIWTPLMLRLARGEPVRHWVFPVLMLLWANMHGGFALGILVWGACLGSWTYRYYFEKPRPPTKTLRNLVIVGGTSILVTLVNPAGLRLWASIFGHVGSSGLMNRHAEWQSPNFHEPNTLPFLLFLALILLVLGRAGRRISLEMSLLLAGFSVLGLYSVRNAPYLVIIAIPTCALLASAILSDLFPTLGKADSNIRSMERGVGGILWPVLICLAVAGSVISGHPLDATRQGNNFNPALFPARALDWLESHPQKGNMFNHFPWGGYILYREWPRYRVFIDGQTEFYGPELTEEYASVAALNGDWQGVLDRYSIAWVIVPTGGVLAQLADSYPPWRVLYQDETATILRRTAP